MESDKAYNLRKAPKATEKRKAMQGDNRTRTETHTTQGIGAGTLVTFTEITDKHATIETINDDTNTDTTLDTNIYTMDMQQDEQYTKETNDKDTNVGVSEIQATVGLEQPDISTKPNTQILQPTDMSRLMELMTNMQQGMANMQEDLIMEIRQVYTKMGECFKEMVPDKQDSEKKKDIMEEVPTLKELNLKLDNRTLETDTGLKERQDLEETEDTDDTLQEHIHTPAEEQGRNTSDDTIHPTGLHPETQEDSTPIQGKYTEEVQSEDTLTHAELKQTHESPEDIIKEDRPTQTNYELTEENIHKRMTQPALTLAHMNQEDIMEESIHNEELHTTQTQGVESTHTLGHSSKIEEKSRPTADIVAYDVVNRDTEDKDIMTYYTKDCTKTKKYRKTTKKHYTKKLEKFKHRWRRKEA